MSAQPVGPDELLTPADVAAILYVDPKTVTRWAIAGKITAIRTPGGHTFLKNEILALRHTVNSPRVHLRPSPRPRPAASPDSGPGEVSRPMPARAPPWQPERHLAIAEATVVAEAVATAREAPG